MTATLTLHVPWSELTDDGRVPLDELHGGLVARAAPCRHFSWSEAPTQKKIHAPERLTALTDPSPDMLIEIPHP